MSTTYEIEYRDIYVSPGMLTPEKLKSACMVLESRPHKVDPRKVEKCMHGLRKSNHSTMYFLLRSSPRIRYTSEASLLYSGVTPHCVV